MKANRFPGQSSSIPKLNQYISESKQFDSAIELLQQTLQSSSIPGSKRFNKHCKAFRSRDRSASTNIAKRFDSAIEVLRQTLQSSSILGSKRFDRGSAGGRGFLCACG